VRNVNADTKYVQCIHIYCVHMYVCIRVYADVAVQKSIFGKFWEIQVYGLLWTAIKYLGILVMKLKTGRLRPACSM